MDYEEEDM